MSNRVLFSSNFLEQVVVMEPGVSGDETKKGKRIEFQDGLYSTENKEEISFLREISKNPNPGCKIDEIEDAELEIDWEEKVKQYATGSGWYKVDGENIQGKEAAIEAIKELEG